MFKKRRVVETYLYGEEDKISETTFSGTDFYLSIMNMEPFATIYFLARKNFFDFYNWAIGLVKIVSMMIKFLFQRNIFDLYFSSKKIFFVLGKKFSEVHSGSLHRYISWVMIGFAIVLIIYLR
jgi:hypothetical protein